VSDIKPGIYTMPAWQYHADPAPQPSLSNSLLTTLIQNTPRHAWLKHPRLNSLFNPAKSGGVFELGDAAHALLLEGVDKAHIIDAPDWRKKEHREARDKARAAGLVPMLPQQHDGALAMVQAAREFISNTGFTGIFERAKPEQTLIWQDVGGIWCRARLDLLELQEPHTGRPLVLDYKTTGAGGPGEWMRRYLAAHGYDTQGVWYPRGLSALGYPGARFVFLVQENFEPFMCYLVELTEARVELATNKISRGVMLWRDCIGSNRWPGYSPEIYQAYPTAWEIKDEEALGV
jgi:hypothetical protein